jgi:hypothetical protein
LLLSIKNLESKMNSWKKLPLKKDIKRQTDT